MCSSDLEPFFLGKALFAGHGTTDVFPVDVFFGNSDIVHRSTLPYLCTFSCLLRHSDLFVFGCGLSHPSIAAHQGSHFLDVVQRERRRAQGLHGNAHELHGIVVCRHPVGTEFSAAFAAMDDGPLAALAYPDRHRLHDAAAVGGTVAGFFIHMKAGQAVGAMVAVEIGRASCRERV